MIFYVPDNPQDKERWEGEANEYFRGRYNLTRNGRMSLVTGAIKGLGLSVN